MPCSRLRGLNALHAEATKRKETVDRMDRRDGDQLCQEGLGREFCLDRLNLRRKRPIDRVEGCMAAYGIVDQLDRATRLVAVDIHRLGSKQRFKRWNFFFVNGMFYNLSYIFTSWKLGFRELGAKIFVFQEVYETLLYLFAPFVLPISLIVRPAFCAYLMLGTLGLYFVNVTVSLR